MEFITQTINRADICRESISLGYTTALWRLPKSKEKELIIATNDAKVISNIDISILPSGFLIAPFVGKESNFIPADNYYIFDENDYIIQEKLTFEVVPKTAIQLPYQTKKSEKKDFIPTQKEDFIAATNAAIVAIESGLLRKVVLSRTKNLTLPDDFNLIAIFDKLCILYPNAFVSMVYLPNLEQIWLGASPEILISQDENSIFKTMALAGTQSAISSNGEQIKAAHASWTQKEIEEQALVSRYIIDCFKKIRLREFEEEGPKTINAGNLLHLQTDFVVDMQAVGFPELSTVMLDLLHPTSAVCGMPKEPALAFILEKETHSRIFYSGFLGPINIAEKTSLFVNLRTMKIEDGMATLFAGCGITADSIPEKEWLETEMKCQTLEAVLN